MHFHEKLSIHQQTIMTRSTFDILEFCQIPTFVLQKFKFFKLNQFGRAQPIQNVCQFLTYFQTSNKEMLYIVSVHHEIIHQVYIECFPIRG